MYEIPAASHRPAVLSADDRTVLSAVVDDCARIFRGQLDLLAFLRRQRVISKEAYTGLLARGDQVQAAVAELTLRCSAAEPLPESGVRVRSGGYPWTRLRHIDGAGEF